MKANLIGDKIVAEKDSFAYYELDVMTFVDKLIKFKLDVLKDTPWMGLVGDGDMIENWKAMFEGWDKDTSTIAKSHISIRW